MAFETKEFIMGEGGKCKVKVKVSSIAKSANSLFSQPRKHSKVGNIGQPETSL